jgi:hypothetical protein
MIYSLFIHISEHALRNSKARSNTDERYSLFITISGACAQDAAQSGASFFLM